MFNITSKYFSFFLTINHLQAERVAHITRDFLTCYSCWYCSSMILEALIFQNTSTWMLSSISNRAIFFSEYFYLKNHQKKTRTFILTSMMRGNSIIAFHLVFIITFYAVNLQKLFLLILISLKRHTFNIKHYTHKIYLHKRFILVYRRKTKKQNISKSLLRNLIL